MVVPGGLVHLGSPKEKFPLDLRRSLSAGVVLCVEAVAYVFVKMSALLHGQHDFADILRRHFVAENRASHGATVDFVQVNFSPNTSQDRIPCLLCSHPAQKRSGKR